MSYNQHKLYQINQMMMNCELPLGMVHVSLILDHNMGMNYAEEPFNMVMFFNLRHPSKWLHFQTPNTHIRAFLYWSAPPPQGGLVIRCTTVYSLYYCMITQSN